MKKALNRVISICICIMLIIATNSIAFAGSANEKYRFIYPDNTVVEYYLDEYGNPYIIKEGEKIVVALPLEHLRVTDKTKYGDLYTSLNSVEGGEKSPPSYYYDLSTGANTSPSQKYTMNITFAGINLYTHALKFNVSHEAIRIKTSDIVKKYFWSSKNIDFDYLYYYPETDYWYTETFRNVDCTEVNGYGFQHSPEHYPYGKFYIYDNGNIKSMTLEVWTTYIW